MAHAAASPAPTGAVKQLNGENETVRKANKEKNDLK